MGNRTLGKKIVRVCGSYPEAVNAVMNLGRILWKLAFVNDRARAYGRHARILDEGQLVESMLPLGNDITALLLDDLRSKRLSGKTKHDELYFDLSVFQPVTIVREFLGGLKPDHELRYFVLRNIREHYKCYHSPQTAYLFSLLASTLDSLRFTENQTYLFQPIDIKKPTALLMKLRNEGTEFSQYIYRRLSPDIRKLIDEYDSTEPLSEVMQDDLIEDLNRLLQSDDFYQGQYFKQAKLSHTARNMLQSKLHGDELIKLNRYVLTSIYSEEIGGRKFNRSSIGATQKSKNIWNYSKELLPYLKHVLKSDLKFSGSPDVAVELFMECCRATDYIRAHYNPGCIKVHTAAIDAQFLLTNLFGMPTGIRGFDDLFGGGGLMLSEGSQSRIPNKINGRTILIIGRFGTGKSLLSLQLSVEVARKGGLAWVIPLEQSAEECLYTLESMRALPNDRSVIIATTESDLKTVLKDRNNNPNSSGALIILSAVKDSFDDFRAAFSENAARINNYPLRLITIDPVNSILRSNNQTVGELRAQTLEMIKEIEESGTNVMLIAEEGADKENELLFEQNIADTVIHLSVIERHGYATRYLEVQKSRLQREQRGKHPFSIVPSIGVRVYLSSAAVSNRIRPRGLRTPDTPVRFGLPSFDNLLGENGLAAGDVIAFQGEGGSYKTSLGLLFLLDTDWDPLRHEVRDRKNFSLLIAARDDETTIRYLLKQDFVREHCRTVLGKSPDDIIIRSFPRGNVNPSFIIQQIEYEFLKVRLKGHSIDRVMVDNIAHWEMSCPFVRDDSTFADTLVDFLRRQRVTSLMVCGDISGDTRSVVQRPIIDDSDCVVRFDKVEFRGTHRVMLRVMKTRGMRHRLESFEVALGSKSIEVKPGPSLLRVGKGGQVATVKTRLFLHSETRMQEDYNHKFLAAVKSVLSRDTEIEYQERAFVNRALNLGAASAVDELHVLQLDEYEVPSLAHNTSKCLPLYAFTASQWDDEWDDVLPRIETRIQSSNDGFCAIPFYQNVSLLAYRPDQLSEKTTKSWVKLVDECDKWEKEYLAPESVFFDYPRNTGENYNCLFFEILLSLEELPSWDGHCQLHEWIHRPAAIEASKIYRRLCRKAYLSGGMGHVIMQEPQTTKDFMKVNHKAVVWRHWYSTLNQMMSDLDPEERQNIQVCPLPGGKTIAGEWYLCIPFYSAAPDVGLEIIKLLTSHEAELDRVRTGVGLPTRSTFYDTKMHAYSVDTGISPYFSMNAEKLGELVKTAFPRSTFGCYSQFSGILAYHLQKIIEIQDKDEKIVEWKIGSIFESLEARIKFVSPERDCSRCHIQSPHKGLVRLV